MRIPKLRITLAVLIGAILFFVMTWMVFPHTVVGGPQPRGVPFIFAKHGCNDFGRDCVDWMNYGLLVVDTIIWLAFGYVVAWFCTRKKSRASVGGLT